MSHVRMTAKRDQKCWMNNGQEAKASYKKQPIKEQSLKTTLRRILFTVCLLQDSCRPADKRNQIGIKKKDLKSNAKKIKFKFCKMKSLNSYWKENEGCKSS